jgi:hypothetical protein
VAKFCVLAGVEFGVAPSVAISLQGHAPGPTWRSRRTGRYAAQSLIYVAGGQPLSSTLARFVRGHSRFLAPLSTEVCGRFKSCGSTKISVLGGIPQRGKDLRSAVGGSQFIGYSQEGRCKFRRALTWRSRRTGRTRRSSLFSSLAASRLALR